MTSQGQPLLCPSAQPGMHQLRLIGVIEYTEHGSRVAYLNEDVPVTADLLGQAGPALPRVFRLAGTCEERSCAHFDGERCNLVRRIVNILPPVVDAPPVCLVRSTCRWFEQEGYDACVRCPQVVTEVAEPTDEFRRAALPDPPDCCR